MTDAAPTPRANQGDPRARVDARAKVTGETRYAADMAVPAPAFAFLVTSEIARGRIAAIDEAAARAVPGVIDVMTWRNRPLVRSAPTFGAGGAALTALLPLDGPEIHHHGEIVAMVLAESFEAAREAAHRLAVTYEAEPHATTFGSPGAVDQSTVEVLPMRTDPALGDLEAGLAQADVVIDRRYSTPVQHHNPMELFSTTAVWQGEELTVHEPSQFVYGLRETLAEQLGIPPEMVRAQSEYVGGGFGSKGPVGQRTVLAALAARQLGRPVKLTLTRAQGFTLAGHRQETESRVRLGATRDGRLLAYGHELREATSRVDTYVNAGIENGAAMYAWSHVQGTHRMVRVDRNTPTFMRSPPEVPVIYALEHAMDEMAVELGMDPVAFRKLNDTQVNPVTGKPYSSRSLVQCLDEGAAAFGWDRRTSEPGSMRDGDWLVGWGCAMATYPTSSGSCVARLRYTVDGTARVEFSGADLGTGAYTIFGQAAADLLGLPPDRVTVVMGDTRLPPGPLAGGSMSTASGVSAITLAAERVLGRLGIAREATGGERAAAFERLKVGAVEEQGDYAPAGGRTGSTAGAWHGQLDSAGGVNAGNDRPTAFAFGAEFVEVRVHARTREIRVPRMVGAFAAGRILNTRTARSQLMGGMIWGVASALHEATEMDPRRAAYVNDNLAEYLLAVNADIPGVEVILVPEVDDSTPSGAKGLGELGNVGTAAAVASAVFHATGVRVRDLPIRIESLLGARAG